VGERTVLLVVTRRTTGFQIARAKLSLVLVGVVELLNAIVCSVTIVAFGAVSALNTYILADFRLVCSKRAPSIFVKVMIKGASLQVVILRLLLTWIYFEGVQVEE